MSPSGEGGTARLPVPGDLSGTPDASGVGPCGCYGYPGDVPSTCIDEDPAGSVLIINRQQAARLAAALHVLLDVVAQAAPEDQRCVGALDEVRRLRSMLHRTARSDD